MVAPLNTNHYFKVLYSSAFLLKEIQSLTLQFIGNVHMDKVYLSQTEFQ
jgi:hypothetical protein